MKRSLIAYLALASACLIAAAPRFGQDPRKERLRVALKDHDMVGKWYYDNLPGALREGKKTKKPLLIVFR